MTTNNAQTLPPKSPLERLAASYGEQPPAAPAAAPPPSSAEERLAAAYSAPTTPKPAAPKPAAPTQPESREATADDAAPPADGAKPPAAAPYEFKPSAEGYKFDDAESVTAFSDVARELKLDNAAAQKIVDKMLPALNARTARQVSAVVDGWAAETHADREIGGAHLDATIADAQRALEAHGSPELRKLLGPPSKGGSGIGNHRAMLRFLASVGRRLTTAERMTSTSTPRPTLADTNRSR